MELRTIAEQLATGKQHDIAVQQRLLLTAMQRERLRIDLIARLQQRRGLNDDTEPVVTQLMATGYRVTLEPAA